MYVSIISLDEWVLKFENDWLKLKEKLNNNNFMLANLDDFFNVDKKVLK